MLPVSGLARRLGALLALPVAVVVAASAIAAPTPGRLESTINANDNRAGALANMLVSAHGFTDLLDRMAQVRDIERQNAQVTLVVKEQRVSMAAVVARLSDLRARRQRITTAHGADHVQLLGSPL